MKQHKASLQHQDYMLENWYLDQIEYYSQENQEIDFNNQLAKKIFGKAYLDWLNDSIGTDLQFLGIWQPKEYNFTSDHIDFTFNMLDYEKLCFLFNDEYLALQLKSYIKEQTTTKSGYIALKTYDDVLEDKNLFFQAMLQVYSNLNAKDFEVYFDRQHVYDNLHEAIKEA